MKTSDKERLKKVIEKWERLALQMQQHNITKEMLLTDEYSQWAVNTPLYNIGEQVYQLSDLFKEAHPELPWNKIAGFRHRLVHDYDNTNWEFVAEIILKDMPEFIEAVRKITTEMDE